MKRVLKTDPVPGTAAPPGAARKFDTLMAIGNSPRKASVASTAAGVVTPKKFPWASMPTSWPGAKFAATMFSVGPPGRAFAKMLFPLMRGIGF